MSEQVEKSENHVAMTAFMSLLIGGLALGTSPIFMRYGQELVTPTSAAFWRLALSIPLMVIWLAYDIQKNGRTATPSMSLIDLKPLIIVGFFFALDLVFWHWSVQLTTVANATLLANMAAIFTAAGGFLFFGERFSRTFIGGMFLALIGAIALMGSSFELNKAHLSGDLIALVAAVAYAGYMVMSGQARRRFSTVSIVLGTAVFGCLFLLPIALLETGNFVPDTITGWWPLIALAWFTHVIGQSCIVYALAHLPAAFGSVSLLIQPLIAAMLAWVLFAEALGVYHLVGATLIISGIIVSKKGV